MESTNADKYTLLKRKIYLVIFPILFVTNASYWLFSPYVDRFLELVLPPVCLFFAIVWLLIYFNRFMRASEIICLVVFSFYHLYRVYTMTVQLEDGIINAYVLWSTVYFIYVFMALERKKALVFALFIFLITFLFGIPHFHDARVNDTLIQYYTSTIVYILVLFYFQQIVSTYIESDILRKNAYYDALTGIGNRRLIDMCLENEVNRCKNSQNTFSIIYFDIDHFKQINDEYGHDIGDHILKEFTSVVKNYVPPSDLFGRWGGEEFIIILKNQSLPEATKLAEKLRSIIEQHSFQHVERLTSSFGVSSFQINDSPSTLIKRADQALYMAKHSGRNTIQTQ